MACRVCFRLVCAVALCTVVLTAPAHPPLSPPQISGAGTRTISGSVVLRGAIVGPIRITVESRSRSIHRTVVADGSGSFTLSGMPVGEYLFEIESEGYRTRRESVDIPPGTGIFPLQFILDPLPPAPTPYSTQPSVSVSTLQVPEKARREYEAGERDVERKRWKGARRHFEKALAIHAEFPRALYALAMLDMSENKNEKAIEGLRRSVEIDSSFAEGFILLSHLLNAAQDYQGALATSEKAVALRPDVWQAHYEQGMAALSLGLIGVAQQASQRIDGLEGEKPPDVRLLRVGVLLKLGRLQEAKVELAGFLEEAPHHAMASLARRTLEAVEAKLAGGQPK